MIATDTQGRRVLLAEYANAATRQAMWKYEADDGETYAVEVDGQTWTVTRDVWNDVTEDWESAPVAMTVDAFMHEHQIHALVTGHFRARS